MRSDRHLYDPERGREEKIKKKKKEENRAKEKTERTESQMRILFT